MAGAAQAQATLVCDNCTLIQQREGAKKAGAGEHFVIDPTRVTLTKWRVEYVPDGPTYVARQVATPDELMQPSRKLRRQR